MLFNCGELSAVTEKFADQDALRVDRPALFHNQHRHQAVGDQEQHSQDWQPAVLLLRRRTDDLYNGCWSLGGIGVCE